jgi:hypothetical protein
MRKVLVWMIVKEKSEKKHDSQTLEFNSGKNEYLFFLVKQVFLNIHFYSENN